VRARPRRLSLDPPELNLIPLLDMISLLIQLLLVNAQFGSYAEIASKVASRVEVDEDAEKLHLEVRLTPDGYLVRWSEAGDGYERALPCTAACATPEDWDTRGLLSLASSLKGRHPEEEQVILRSSPGIPFEALVVTMDAVRRDPAATEPLFPDVVLAEGGP
jgi:hypothetical protein